MGASEVIHPTRSLVAGSPHGVRSAKLFLRPLLQRAQARADFVTSWTFIDDAVLRSEGTATQVETCLVRASADLKAGLDECRLVPPDLRECHTPPI